MRVVVKRCGYDIVVMQLDNTGCCSRSHEVRTVMRIPNQDMDISHFVCTIPDNATAGIVRLVVCAFAAGIAAKDADRGSEYDRVERLSGALYKLGSVLWSQLNIKDGPRKGVSSFLAITP